MNRARRRRPRPKPPRAPTVIPPSFTRFQLAFLFALVTGMWITHGSILLCGLHAIFVLLALGARKKISGIGTFDRAALKPESAIEEDKLYFLGQEYSLNLQEIENQKIKKELERPSRMRWIHGVSIVLCGVYGFLFAKFSSSTGTETPISSSIAGAVHVLSLTAIVWANTSGHYLLPLGLSAILVTMVSLNTETIAYQAVIPYGILLFTTLAYLKAAEIDLALPVRKINQLDQHRQNSRESQTIRLGWNGAVLLFALAFLWSLIIPHKLDPKELLPSQENISSLAQMSANGVNWVAGKIQGASLPTTPPNMPKSLPGTASFPKNLPQDVSEILKTLDQLHAGQITIPEGIPGGPGPGSVQPGQAQASAELMKGILGHAERESQSSGRKGQSQVVEKFSAPPGQADLAEKVQDLSPKQIEQFQQSLENWVEDEKGSDSPLPLGEHLQKNPIPDISQEKMDELLTSMAKLPVPREISPQMALDKVIADRSQSEIGQAGLGQTGPGSGTDTGTGPVAETDPDTEPDSGLPEAGRPDNRLAQSVGQLSPEQFEKLSHALDEWKAHTSNPTSGSKEPKQTDYQEFKNFMAQKMGNSPTNIPVQLGRQTSSNESPPVTQPVTQLLPPPTTTDAIPPPDPEKTKLWIEAQSIEKFLKQIWKFAKIVLVFVILSLIWSAISPRKRTDTEEAEQDYRLDRKSRKDVLRQAKLIQKQKLNPRDEVIALYQLFLKSMKLAGLARPEHLPPTNYGFWIKGKFWQIGSSSTHLTDVFCHTFYGETEPSAGDLKSYRKSIDQVLTAIC